MAVKPVPEGYHTVTPYLVVKDGESMLTFMKQAFNAKEVHISRHADNRIWHADVLIGDSHVMFAQGNEQHPAQTASVYTYVPNTDETYRRAIAAGATSIMEPADMFYGDRNAGVKDCCGNSWWIGTHIEDVPPAELERRMAEETRRRTTASR